MTGTPEVDIPQSMPDAPAAQSVSAPVEVVPVTPEISKEMSAAGVEPTGSAAPPPTPIISDHGAQMTTVASTTSTTLTVPANQQQLLDWAKGDPNNSLTWLSKFWIRRIKQAVKHHWNLIMPPPTVQPVQQVGQPVPNQPIIQPTIVPVGQALPQTPIQYVQAAQPVQQIADPQVQPVQTQQVQSQDPDYNM